MREEQLLHEDKHSSTFRTCINGVRKEVSISHESADLYVTIVTKELYGPRRINAIAKKLWLELKGTKFRGASAYSQAKKTLKLKGSRAKVLDQLNGLLSTEVIGKGDSLGVRVAPAERLLAIEDLDRETNDPKPKGKPPISSMIMHVDYWHATLTMDTIRSPTVNIEP